MALARIGVVGAGWWACEFHIPHLLKNPHADLVAVSRLGKEELDKIQQRFEIQVASENHLELYAHDLDGVIVASPHVLHEEHASAAIENGCHVLVEKPMTTDIEGARRLHTLAAAYIGGRIRENPDDALWPESYPLHGEGGRLDERGKNR